MQKSRSARIMLSRLTPNYLKALQNNDYKCLYFGAEDAIGKINLEDSFDEAKNANISSAIDYITNFDHSPFFALILLTHDNELSQNIDEINLSLSKIIDCIDSKAIKDNTLLLLTAVGNEQNITPFEFNVPFIVRYPEVIKPQRHDVVLGTADIMPAIMSLLNMDKTNHSISSVLESQTDIIESQYALYLKDHKVSSSLTDSIFPYARGIKHLDYSMTVSITDNLQLSQVQAFNDTLDPLHTTPLCQETNQALFNKLFWSLADALEKSNDIWYRDKIIGDIIPYSN